MQCMSINDWFEKITGGESYNAVAKKAGVQASSIWRQLPDRLSEKNAVAIARAYGRPAIEPLIIMGLLTDDDIKAIKSQDALRDASDDELMAELGRRIKASSEDPKWQQPPKVEKNTNAPVAHCERRGILLYLVGLYGEAGIVAADEYFQSFADEWLRRKVCGRRPRRDL